MSLPVVLIFERHWDTVPKILLKDLLPDLAEQGYDTLCFEAPQNISPKEIVDRHNEGLKFDFEIQQEAENFLKKKEISLTEKLSDISFSALAQLMRLYVSSRKYLEVAEKIKQLPASYILKEVFDEASKLAVCVKGVDINHKNFEEIVSLDPSKRMASIRDHEDLRIATMFQNLLTIRAQQEGGVIFVCGAFHACGLLTKFKQQNMQDDVLYYFPHSPSRYDKGIDDIEDVVMNGVNGISRILVDHTHRLTQEEVMPFSRKIIKEITSKIKYTKEIPNGNSHTQFLSQVFKVHFRAFLRPGYHVDALLESDSFAIESIQKRVCATGVQIREISLNGRKYMVVPNVNTRDVADRLRKITF